MRSPKPIDPRALSRNTQTSPVRIEPFVEHESTELTAGTSPSEGFDEDEYNRQLIERRHRSINVTRSFELRGVFKRLARSRLLPLRHVFRPAVRSRAPRPARRTRATARSPGRKSDPPHLALAGGAAR